MLGCTCCVRRRSSAHATTSRHRRCRTKIATTRRTATMRRREAKCGRDVLDAYRRPTDGQAQRRAARIDRRRLRQATRDARSGETQQSAAKSCQICGKDARRSFFPRMHLLNTTRPCDILGHEQNCNSERALAIVGYKKRKEHECKAVGAIGLSRGGAEHNMHFTVCESALCRFDHFWSMVVMVTKALV